MNQKIESLIKETEEKGRRLKELIGRRIRVIEIPNSTTASSQTGNEEMSFLVRICLSIIKKYGYKVEKESTIKNETRTSNNGSFKSALIAKINEEIKKTSQEWEDFASAVLKELQSYIDSLSIPQEEKSKVMSNLNFYEIIRFSPTIVMDKIESMGSVNDIDTIKAEIISEYSQSVDATTAAQIENFHKADQNIKG